VSADNPVIMLIFLIYSLIFRWGNVSNSNVTMKFAQIQYFLSQNVGRYKKYYVPPIMSKSWGGHVLLSSPYTRFLRTNTYFKSQSLQFHAVPFLSKF